VLLLLIFLINSGDAIVLPGIYFLPVLIQKLYNLNFIF